MKKITIAILFFISLAGFAQETGMKFEHDASWQQILEKAKKENKFIFLDAFASWCGPCKWMAKEVFPKTEVGAIVNGNYINAKIDMEKGEGLELAKKYNVRNYPTYLFFDANGNLVHRSLGSMPAEDFIRLCKNTLNPDKQYISLQKKYLDGKRDTAFLRIFVENANDAQDSLAQPALKEFLKAVKYELTTENAKLISYTTNSIHDTGYTIIQTNIKKFIEVSGENAINSQIEELVWNEARRAGKKGEDKAAFRKVIEQYLPGKTELLCAEYELSLLKRSGNWSAYIIKAQKFANDFCQKDWERLNEIANNFSEYYSSKSGLQKALTISLQSVNAQPHYINNLTTAEIYLKMKDKENAEKHANEAKKYANEEADALGNIEAFLKKVK